MITREELNDSIGMLTRNATRLKQLSEKAAFRRYTGRHKNRESITKSKKRSM
jgi:hypothetical protein